MNCAEKLLELTIFFDLRLNMVKISQAACTFYPAACTFYPLFSYHKRVFILCTTIESLY